MRLNFAKWRAPWPAQNPISLIIIVTLLALVAGESLFLLRRNAAPTFYWNQFRGWDRPMAWISVAIMFVAVFVCSLTRKLDAECWESRLSRRVPWMVVISFFIYLGLGEYISDGFAYTPDEFCAILQAQTFALGKVTPQVPPELIGWMIPKNLQGDLVYISQVTGRYSPLYWPGYAFLLAPFAFFKVEWLCNPLITSLSLWLWFKITCRLTGDERAGLWAVVFALLSATIIFNAATFFSMPAHLLFNLLFCWFFIADRRSTFFWAGFVGGFTLVLHNPLPHFSFALPWIFWTFRQRRHHFLWLILGYLVVAPLVGISWSLHLGEFRQGNVSSTPNFAEVMARVAYAFQPPDITLMQVRLAALIKLLLWASPGTVVLAWLGWRQASAKKHLTQLSLAESSGTAPDWNAHYLWLLGASVVSNFAVYLFVRYDEGHAWGFRYLHHTWLALPILAAAFLISHRERYLVGIFAPRPWVSLQRFTGILCFLGLVVLLPLRIGQGRTFLHTVRDARPTPAISAPATITFISEDQIDASAAIRNDPFLRNKDWHFRSRGREKNAALAKRWLLRARRVESAQWGEFWAGDGFSRAASPLQFPAR